MDKKKIILALFIFRLMTPAVCQDNFARIFDNKKVKVGVCLSLGTHIFRFGICLNGSVVINRFEFFLSQRLYFNQYSWGPPVPSFEWISSWGGSASWGHYNKNNINIFDDFYFSQTGFLQSAGYAMNFYTCSNGTSQRTGTFWYTFGKISIVTENDLFARRTHDRFRTAAVGVIQKVSDFDRIFIKNILWTGQYGHKKSIEHPHFRLGCYLDSTGGKFISYSNGILNIGIQSFRLHPNNRIAFSSGIEHEKIRDFVQNKLIHDMIFLPGFLLKKSRNCHLPMIDHEGNLFLFNEGQKIRRGMLFLSVSQNEPIFY